jgi:hypothetical protein
MWTSLCILMKNSNGFSLITLQQDSRTKSKFYRSRWIGAPHSNKKKLLSCNIRSLALILKVEVVSTIKKLSSWHPSGKSPQIP